MKVWNSFPMLRLILPFLVGVISASFVPEFVDVGVKEIVPIYSFLSIAVLFGFVLLNGTRKHHLFGLLLWPSLLLLGGILTFSVSDSIFPGSLVEANLTDAEKSYIAVIVDEPQVKPKSVKVVATITDIERTSHGKVLLYFKKDSVSSQLKYGQEIVLRTKLERVVGMGNPNEFNYTRYLRFNNIYFRGYVNADNWKTLSAGQFSFTGWFLGVRSELIEILKESGLNGNELSVASALILGFRSELDRELMNAYAGAGATHVLAVSGLHVGIVYMILNFVLSFLVRFKYGRLARTILVVTVLCCYAALTGLSPSVFRAATMFTFVAIGSALSRNTNIFNTLAASAFCLILYEPMIIMQVGFQLSYAAVIGIVLIQPRLFRLYTCKNRLADWAWSITCVSVAAQIATFPLGLLYFHQFPNLFLVSNLLVIPAAAGILYLGFSLFLASVWKPALLFFGFLLETLISILNQVVVWIEKIPYSVLSGIDISTLEAILIYLTITGFLSFIIRENKYGLYASLSLSVLFVSLQIVEVNEQKSQQFITIYNVKKETAIAFVDGTRVTFLASKSLWENDQAMLFHVRHHWWRIGVEEETFVELSDSLLNRKLHIGKNTWGIIDTPRRSGERARLELDNLDYVVIQSLLSNRVSLESLQDKSTVFLNGNLSDKVKNVLFLQRDINMHDIESKGAQTFASR